MTKVQIPYGGEAVVAEYKSQKIADYQNNPFIEALPEILSKEDAIDRLAMYPPFDEKERELDSHLRYHLVQRLFQYFQPLPAHVDLEGRISRLIRQGYIYRSPIQPNFSRQLQVGHEMLLQRNMEINSQPFFRTTQSALTLIGQSGVGKSTAINQILSTYPQVIAHSRYQEISLSQYQLVWLKLDCPHDGSIKGLTIDFFRNVDLLLGTRYYQQYGSARHPISALQPAMAQIARTYGLGLLVIDEIQHLSTAKSQGSEKMLNFFVTLINTIGVPVVLIGTNKAMGVLQSQFRQARRGSGQGDMIWERMQQDVNWELLLSGLWDYQWVQKPTPMTEALSTALYEESQGITDLAIKLFVMTQIRAIASGKEEISASLIRKVAKENLRLVQPMLQALQSGNLKRIAEFEDLYPIDLDAFIKQETVNLSIDQKIKERQAATKQKRNRDLSIREQAIRMLLELEIDESMATQRVEQVMNGSDQLSLSDIVKNALTMDLSSTAPKKQTPNILSHDHWEGDLRDLVTEGKHRGMTAYEVLKEQGLIKAPMQDVWMVG